MSPAIISNERQQGSVWVSDHPGIDQSNHDKHSAYVLGVQNASFQLKWLGNYANLTGNISTVWLQFDVLPVSFTNG